MSEFFKVDNDGFGIVEDYAIGYENETTFVFKIKEMKKFFMTLDKMKEILEDDELIEALEEKFDIDIEDFSIHGTIYDDENVRAYYFQRDSGTPELCESVHQYCNNNYPSESIWLGNDKNGYSQYEPDWKWTMEDIEFEAIYIKDIEGDYELWKEERGEYIVLKITPPAYQTEKTYYEIFYEGTLDSIKEMFVGKV